MSAKDMTGMEVNSLKVIRRADNNADGDAMWECVCRCGRSFVAKGGSIRRGHTKSCGCLQRQAAANLKGTHRLSRTKLYKKWAGMKQRCYNEHADSFAHYGAKGITVCQEWQDFERFREWALANGYREGLTIEREDNGKGYGPSNCHWATRTEQNRNTTRTHRIVDGGKVITAAETAQIAGLSRSTVAEWCRTGEIETLEDVIRREKNIRNGRHKNVEQDFPDGAPDPRP